ncbi:MAG: hypothetical protein J6A79_19035 [Clostridia bacterium]|nr:hypothetical protein [Clostridia bacterium]
MDGGLESVDGDIELGDFGASNAYVGTQAKKRAIPTSVGTARFACWEASQTL